MSEKLRFRPGELKQIVPFLGLALVVLFFQIASGGRLLSAGNFSVLVNHAFAVIVASCGAVFLMSQGNIDFSMAGNVCVSAAVAALISNYSVPLAVVAALVCGALMGVVNGFVHTYLGLPSFVATLATSFMYGGLANVMLGSGSLAANYSMKALDRLPVKLGMLALVLLATFAVLEFTPFGKQCKAMGSRLEVARQGGIPIKLKKMLPFIICGFSCGIIAIFSILRTCTASTQTGVSTEINTILALLLGGIPFSGGWMTRFRGVILGGLIMAFIINGLVILDVPVIIQQVTKGLLFLIAVAVSFDRKTAAVIK